uniref:Uncharacterized protein n=1 Tax=Cryptomonas curvata TaxID=233186 RepID=A0A7S0MBN0_9CRYP|mmetsp:Transcript_30140/g.63166  ORF Transcript_30140/g.63166 Transcript_30140/m.63166 type:complete len:199 (+) Transcript_30140:2-598(+)
MASTGLHDWTTYNQRHCQRSKTLDQNHHQISDQRQEQSNGLPLLPTYAKKANWLKHMSLSKTMPLYLKPGATAEDDDVSALRTSRYLKLETSSEIELPCPRKFVGSSRPTSRFTRSQSAYTLGCVTGSSTKRSDHFFELHGQAFDTSSLCASLLLDDFELSRPPSFAAMCEGLMSDSGGIVADKTDFRPCRCVVLNSP